MIGKPPLHILYLEDDPRDAELAQTTLEAAGIACGVTRVETQPEFLTSLKQGEFDLILADYTLPFFDGVSALKIAEEIRPETPFIFVTGTLGEEVAIEALKMGATDYVFKTRLSRIVPSVRRALREGEQRIERKRAEEALRRSEAYLSEAQRLSETGSFGCRLSTGEMFWSEETFRIYGYDRSTKPTVKHVLQRVHPEDKHLVQEQIDRAARDAKGCHVECRLLLPDDSVKHVRIVAHASKNQSGMIEFIGAVMDVTATKRAEEKLRRNEAYLAEAQRLSHTGSFGWKVSTGEILWSEETFRIFGFDRTTQPSVELVLQRVHPQDAAMVKQTLERASQDAKDYDHEYRLLMPDGSVKYLRVVAYALSDKSGNLEFAGAVTDITAAKQAEERIRQSEWELRTVQAELAHVTRVATVGEMTASIAHEVNQPLAAVVTNAAACLRWLAAQPPDMEEARQALGRIISDGNRAGEVMGRIRELVKKSPPRKDRLDINETILELLLLTDAEVHMNRISLQTQLTPGLPLILGDRIQLQQVLLNLIKNAIEAMSGASEGPRELRVTSEKDTSKSVLVAVRDSGPGLTPDVLAHLFDPFYTTKPEGMGMGLAISRSIITAHRGRLWATPNEPRGAIFQFTLPTDGDRIA